MLCTAQEMRELDKHMGVDVGDCRGYVVFVGNLQEGGGGALMVRIDTDAKTKKQTIKVVGTLNGLQ